MSQDTHWLKLLAQDLRCTLITTTSSTADATEDLVSLFAPVPNLSAQEAPVPTAVVCSDVMMFAMKSYL